MTVVTWNWRSENEAAQQPPAPDGGNGRVHRGRGGAALQRRTKAAMQIAVALSSLPLADSSIASRYCRMVWPWTSIARTLYSPIFTQPTPLFRYMPNGQADPAPPPEAFASEGVLSGWRLTSAG